MLLVAYQDLEGVAEDALREHAALSLGEPRSTRSWTRLPSQACLCTTLQVPERRRVVVLYAFCILQNLHRVERVQIHLLARLGALLRPDHKAPHIGLHCGRRFTLSRPEIKFDQKKEGYQAV